MLVPKIMIDHCKNKKKLKMSSLRASNLLGQNEENQVFQEDLVQPQENKDDSIPGLSDLIVGAAIETIEFVLGTVSNTASYLRLWALSLAHSQLASVFFDYAVNEVSKIGQDKWFVRGLLLVGVFPAFAGVTALVLLFMDLMECFLHCLRLHWVEFQNKFFKADGYQFKPFYFEESIDLKEDDFENK